MGTRIGLGFRVDHTLAAHPITIRSVTLTLTTQLRVKVRIMDSGDILGTRRASTPNPNDGDILGTRRASTPNPNDGDILGTRTTSTLKDDGDILGMRSKKRLAPDSSEVPVEVPAEGPETKKKAKKVEKAYDNSNRRVPVETFTPDRLEKYKIWKSSKLDLGKVESCVISGFSRGFVERLENGTIGGCLSEKCLISVEAVTRMFLGDILEKVSVNRGPVDSSTSLTPSEVHEAWSELKGKSSKKFGAV